MGGLVGVVYELEKDGRCIGLLCELERDGVLYLGGVLVGER